MFYKLYFFFIIKHQFLQASGNRCSNCIKHFFKFCGFVTNITIQNFPNNSLLFNNIYNLINMTDTHTIICVTSKYHSVFLKTIVVSTRHSNSHSTRNILKNKRIFFLLSKHLRKYFHILLIYMITIHLHSIAYIKMFLMFSLIVYIHIICIRVCLYIVVKWTLYASCVIHSKNTNCKNQFFCKISGKPYQPHLSYILQYYIQLDCVVTVWFYLSFPILGFCKHFYFTSKSYCK